MAIPESQLKTWSHQGSIAQSAATYQTIKRALEADSTGYAGRNYKVFLQGSYGNDTNIYAESDVDVVIRLDDVHFSDPKSLSPEDKESFDNAFVPATYGYDKYKKDVLKALTDKFGTNVKSGDKAIVIAADGGRRKADVIAAVQFRRYRTFNKLYDENYDKGICFFNGKGERIVNYPKQHSANLTTKHQISNKWLKPMVRILKNMRGRCILEGLLNEGIAPSYYLEGLLYNVPPEKFCTSYQNCFITVFKWIQQEADKQKLVCANEQYYLLRDGCHTCWPNANGEAFINAAIELWNNW